MSSAVVVAPGASGSCRWITSNASSRIARIVLSWQTGSGATGAMDPLEMAGRLLPRGVTPVSGGGPSQGPSTRVSNPLRRSARASPSACICTPPGTVRLYGQTMPIRTLPG